MTKKNAIKKIVKIVIFISFCLVCLVPFWIIVINSLKPEAEANLLGIGLPSNFSFRFDNYLQVINEGGVLRSLFNGIFEAFGSCLIIILFGSLAAFIIDRRRTRITSITYYIFISGLIIPAALVPTFLILNVANLLNTYLGLILIFSTYGLPMSVFLYTGFMKTIPRELDESAFIDGCSPLRMFFQIIFPLLIPVTTTIFIFCFVGAWNDVMIPLFFANGDKWALPLSVYKFRGQYGTRWNLLFADMIISISPLFIVYLFCQRFMIDGLTAGAVKG
jgi:raffinose/stachyose/melibiose transport system permease protein